MAWFQEWFGEEYLELYAQHDTTEARKQVEFFRTTFGKVNGPILDVACGTGRHVFELREFGYDAIGCDLSLTLIAAGIGEHGPMPLVRADMRRLPFRSNSFGGLVNFFTSFGYFSDEAENVQVVHEMARAMRRNGVFLFDYMNVARELQRLIQREKTATPIGEVTIERWFDISDRSFNKRITIAGRRYLERVRGYDLDEITMMFTVCGLTIRDAYGDFDGSEYRPSSPRLILTGRKSG